MNVETEVRLNSGSAKDPCLFDLGIKNERLLFQTTLQIFAQIKFQTFVSRRSKFWFTNGSLNFHSKWISPK